MFQRSARVRTSTPPSYHRSIRTCRQMAAIIAHRPISPIWEEIGRHIAFLCEGGAFGFKPTMMSRPRIHVRLQFATLRRRPGNYTIISFCNGSPIAPSTPDQCARERTLRLRRHHVRSRSRSRSRIPLRSHATRRATRPSQAARPHHASSQMRKSANHHQNRPSRSTRGSNETAFHRNPPRNDRPSADQDGDCHRSRRPHSPRVATNMSDGYYSYIGPQQRHHSTPKEAVPASSKRHRPPPSTSSQRTRTLSPPPASPRHRCVDEILKELESSTERETDKEIRPSPISISKPRIEGVAMYTFAV